MTCWFHVASESDRRARICESVIVPENREPVCEEAIDPIGQLKNSIGAKLEKFAADELTDCTTGGESCRVVEFEVDAAIDAAAACFVGGFAETAVRTHHDLVGRQWPLCETAVTIGLSREMSVRAEEGAQHGVGRATESTVTRCVGWERRRHDQRRPR